jgi:NTP pyrophosphatase (non-canonical NTP hydrolase)
MSTSTNLRDDLTTEEKFRAYVSRLFVKRRMGGDGVHHACTGLAGEAGECLDLSKKSWVYGKEMDWAKLMEEMGDTLHYFFMLMIKIEEETGKKVTIYDVMQNNIAKLNKRYPNGYTDQAAIDRRDQTV